MSRDNKKRVASRKRQGLCINCGIRPQFWGVGCVLGQRNFVKHPDVLPVGLRERCAFIVRPKKIQIERVQTEMRFFVRKLLLTGDVRGLEAKALKLHAGLDNARWRSYAEVGRVMKVTKQRVHQLVKPSKITLARIFGNNMPWTKSGKSAAPRLTV